jgi:hypothetical protein
MTAEYYRNGPQGIFYEGVDWINVALERDQW